MPLVEAYDAQKTAGIPRGIAGAADASYYAPLWVSLAVPSLQAACSQNLQDDDKENQHTAKHCEHRRRSKDKTSRATAAIMTNAAGLQKRPACRATKKGNPKAPLLIVRLGTLRRSTRNGRSRSRDHVPGRYGHSSCYCPTRRGTGQARWRCRPRQGTR